METFGFWAAAVLVMFFGVGRFVRGPVDVEPGNSAHTEGIDREQADETAGLPPKGMPMARAGNKCYRWI